jgi:hypothetical protein
MHIGRIEQQRSRSTAIEIGTPAANALILKNRGGTDAYAALGDDTVAAVYGEGTRIPPNSDVAVAIGDNTHIAAIGSLVEVHSTIQ